MRRKSLFALAALLALLGSSCGSAKDTGFPDPLAETPHATETAHPSPTSTAPVELKGEIDVADNLYEPVAAKVKVGTKVVWRQSGTEPHTVTSDDEKTFDSHPQCLQDTTKCMHEGDVFEFTFTKAGEFPYFCRLHGSKGGNGMAGTIIVEA